MKNLIIAASLMLLVSSCGTRQKEARERKQKEYQSQIDKTLNNILESSKQRFNSSKKDSSVTEKKADKADSSTTTRTTTYYAADGKTPKKVVTSKKTEKKTDRSTSKEARKIQEDDSLDISKNLEDHSQINKQEIKDSEIKESSFELDRSNTIYQNIGGSSGMWIIGIIIVIIFVLWRILK